MALTEDYVSLPFPITFDFKDYAPGDIRYWVNDFSQIDEGFVYLGMLRFVLSGPQVGNLYIKRVAGWQLIGGNQKIEIGNVIKGTNPAAGLREENGVLKLDLTLPSGDTTTLEITSVEMLPAGSDPSVIDDGSTDTVKKYKLLIPVSQGLRGNPFKIDGYGTVANITVWDQPEYETGTAYLVTDLADGLNYGWLYLKNSLGNYIRLIDMRGPSGLPGDQGPVGNSVWLAYAQDNKGLNATDENIPSYWYWSHIVAPTKPNISEFKVWRRMVGFDGKDGTGGGGGGGVETCVADNKTFIYNGTNNVFDLPSTPTHPENVTVEIDSDVRTARLLKGEYSVSGLHVTVTPPADVQFVSGDKVIVYWEVCTTTPPTDGGGGGGGTGDVIFDELPTAGSLHAVYSKGIKQYVDDSVRTDAQIRAVSAAMFVGSTGVSYSFESETGEITTNLNFYDDIVANKTKTDGVTHPKGVYDFVMAAIANANLITLTKAQIDALQAANLLVKMQFYAISDFQTIHNITGSAALNVQGTVYENPTTWAKNNSEGVEQIVILAISGNAFATQAYSTVYPTDIIEYDFNDKICEDGITPRKGKITYRKDVSSVRDTPYDFRNVKHRRYKIAPDAWSAATNYMRNSAAVVLYNNIVYGSKVDNNLNVVPGTDKDKWLPLWSIVEDGTSLGAYISPVSSGFNKLIYWNSDGTSTNYIIPVLANDFFDYYTFNRITVGTTSSKIAGLPPNESNVRNISIAKSAASPYNNIVMVVGRTSAAVNVVFDLNCRNMTFGGSISNVKFGMDSNDNFFKAGITNSGFFQLINFMANPALNQLLCHNIFRQSVICPGAVFNFVDALNEIGGWRVMGNFNNTEVTRDSFAVEFQLGVSNCVFSLSCYNSTFKGAISRIVFSLYINGKTFTGTYTDFTVSRKSPLGKIFYDTSDEEGRVIVNEFV